MKILGKNKKALHDYSVIEEFEAGISLLGWEVKSVKKGDFSLKESYIADEDNELWIYGAHITKWKFGSSPESMNETRKRKLLLHKKEVDKLIFERQRSGYSIIPLNFHLSHGKIKIQLSLAKGRKQADKRQQLKEKDQKLSIARDLKKMGY